MNWAENLYLSDKTAEKKERIIKKAQLGVGMVQVYLITLASNEKNLLDIFHAAHLKQSAFYHQELNVVGIAKGLEDAQELTLQIIRDIYEQTGGFDVRSYFVFPAGERKRRRKRAR
ncbi:MAG: hypothetical protein HFI33_12450 [Lachnospiraceae bacterium]|nr:hypothetical protein [Lachnospiraceae bacterium]